MTSKFDTTAAPKMMANARDLLVDADILRKNGRYKTAISLAVVAIEEAGKAFIHNCHLNDQLMHLKLTDHKAKQQVIWCMFYSERLLGWLTGLGVPEPVLSGEKDITKDYAFTNGVEIVPFETFVKMQQPDTVENDVDALIVEAGSITEGFYKNMKYAQNGVFQMIKHFGLYADERNNASLGDHATDRTARGFIEIGEKSTSLLDMPKHQTKMMVALLNLAPPSSRK